MRKPIGTVVVGVASLDDQDPHPRGEARDPVLAPAVALADRLGAGIHVVHAFELPSHLAAAWRGGAADDGSSPAARYRARMDEGLEHQAADLSCAGGIRCHAREGPGDERLCELAAEVEADLLVVGASRRGRYWQGILGSTAERVLAHAPAPVLILRQPVAEVADRVLLTTDLAEGSAALHRRALEMVAALLPDQVPRFRCLHVVSYDPMLPPPLPSEALVEGARAELERLVADCTQGGQWIDARVRIGDPGREIAHEASAWGADLLVVGTHGDPRRAGAPFGRVATAALRGSSCNVLALPTVLPARPGPAAGRAVGRVTVHAGGTQTPGWR